MFTLKNRFRKKYGTDPLPTAMPLKNVTSTPANSLTATVAGVYEINYYTNLSAAVGTTVTKNTEPTHLLINFYTLICLIVKVVFTPPPSVTPKATKAEIAISITSPALSEISYGTHRRDGRGGFECLRRAV